METKFFFFFCICSRAGFLKSKVGCVGGDLGRDVQPDPSLLRLVAVLLRLGWGGACGE